MELTKVAPRKAPKVGTSFVGEFYAANGDFVGMLHRAGSGMYRVLAVESGIVHAESGILTSAHIRRAGELQVSASRSVRKFTEAA